MVLRRRKLYMAWPFSQLTKERALRLLEIKRGHDMSKGPSDWTKLIPRHSHRG